MFCSNCGATITENSTSCPSCGAVRYDGPVNTYDSNYQQTVNDKPNVIVNILSLCCIPILGIILYFVWKESQPKAAKSALIFSLIGIGISVLLSIIFFGIGIFAGIADDSYYY